MKQATIFTILLLALAACAQQPTQAEETVYTIGAIAPLSGDGAAYGIPAQKVAELAAQDVNEQWDDARLEIIWEDGKCTGAGGLAAAQKLVNFNGVNVIFGGACSGETLGAAPFTEQNDVLLFSSISSSPDVTEAGDFVFRNYPSDDRQMSAMTDFIQSKGYSQVAILSENTDYAQAQREAYKELLPAAGIEVVADEVVASETKDIRTEIAKIEDANPNAVLVVPQTIPMAGIFAKQLFEADLEAQLLGNDISTLDETINNHPTELEGFFGVRADYPESEAYERMQSITGCEIGLYCATTYDAVFLLAEKLEECGEDPVCIRDSLYATQRWEGPLAGEVSFDENGDVTGGFVIFKATDGQWIPLE